MSRLRVVPYRQMRRVAEACGFEFVRRVSSHCTFRHPDGRVIVIPDPGSHDLVRPLIRRLIRDLGISPDEYHRLLGE